VCSIGGVVVVDFWTADAGADAGADGPGIRGFSGVIASFSGVALDRGSCLLLQKSSIVSEDG
jgi:hypothetical protein